ncbi:MAG: RecX family transcriptional regulator [Candidatus Dormiibacterota bacterium]
MRQRSSSRDSTPGRDPRKNQPVGSALDAGLRLLGRRAHSRVELRRKLARRGYSTNETEAALSRLVELGYLDDKAFAAGHVRRRGGVRGPLALSAELAARGVDRAEADAALAAFDQEAQLASATYLAERLCARKLVGGYREMLDQVGSKLVRRGFSPAIVRAACQAVLAGTSTQPEA